MKYLAVVGIALLFATLALGEYSISQQFLSKINKPYLEKVQQVSEKHGIAATSPAKCILCGLVVNELEGFLVENKTEQEIIEKLTTTVCAHLGGVKQECDDLVESIPDILEEIEGGKQVSVICVNRGFCEAPFLQRPDYLPVEEFNINLDLPASVRWKKICSLPEYITPLRQILAGLTDLFGNITLISDLGKTLNRLYFPTEYAEEIRGCAEEAGVDYGWLTLFNMGYEVTDGCTSIVAQTNDNKILHVRNMDFWDGIWLTEHLKNITITANYQTGGKTVFHATTFVGFVGVLSGMRPNGFSISIDTRNYPDGIGELFYEVIAAITEKNASLVSFLSRNTLTRVKNFEDAVSSLSRGVLIADVYYIVGGVSANQGAVITRNRENASDIWRLQAPTAWFEVQTNYDHWKQPPWFDNRVDPANHAMVGLGRNNLTLDGLLKEVLSVKPVLNIQSTFSMLACAADDTYKSLVRNCAYPCVE